MGSSDEVADLKQIACDTIDKHAEELNGISQQIWSNPELYYEEHKAHKLLTDYLQTKGFQVHQKYKLDTAFRAVPHENGHSKPNIAILCEYDALPEIGHACGHNLIAEVGIGASLGIRAALQASKTSLGQLTVLGAPAEESGGGKVDFIREGVFDNVDVALMAHPSNLSAASTIVLTCTEVVVTYYGKASHAAGHPWEGINALDAVVLAYTNISAMRQQCKPSWRMHGVITKGGAVPNVIPEEGQLHYYLRTSTRAELTTLIAKAEACFQAAAIATGCRVETQWDPKPYHNMLANPTLVRLYEENCARVGVDFCQDEVMLSTPTGSTDMGNVSHHVPSIHPLFFIGTHVGAHTIPFREAAGSPMAQPHALQQSKALAMTAIDIYCCRDLLKQSQADFAEDKKRDDASA